MNQREKLQAQLEILQQIKSQFSKEVVIPSGEDFASIDTRYVDGDIVISMTFRQMEFENKMDSNADMFFDDFMYEIENQLEDIAEQEADAYAQSEKKDEYAGTIQLLTDVINK
jgi:hypothetical protein